MILNIKKKLQIIFKNIGYKVFFHIYGKIISTISPENNNQIKVSKVSFINNSTYRIFEISKGRIYTDTVSDTAFIIDNKIIEGPSFQYRNAMNKDCRQNIVFEKGTPKIKKKIKGTVLSLLTGGAGNFNYWHWIFDVLPRLGIAEKKNILKEIDFFLFPDTKKRFQVESLNLLKIEKLKRLSSLNHRHIESDRIISVDHPYVLTNNATSDIQNIPIWIIRWLQSKFIKTNLSKGEFPKKIYINRKDSPYESKNIRKIINEEEVIKFLEKSGFVSMVLSELSFEQQIKLFCEAEFVTGLHGAGFANIVFCKPETKILELKPHTSGDVIKNLAKNVNLKYQDISIKPSINDLQNQSGQIIIPLTDLKNKIN